MGKVMVLGKAEKKVAPDSCDIIITIESKKNTTALAAKENNVLCEKLLSKLQDIGMDLQKIEIVEDEVSQDRDYHSEKITYKAQKRIRVRTTADTSVINTIKSLMENDMTGVSYRMNYSVSNEMEIRRQLMKEAVMESRRKADFLAESIGSKIIGVDSANLTGREDVYDVAENEEIENASESEGVFPYLCGAGSTYPLSDNLKPEEIKLDAEVKIVWLLSSD